VCKVLGSGGKKMVEALAGGVVSWNDEEGIASGGSDKILDLVGLRVLSFTHQKPLRVRESSRCRTDEYQSSSVRTIAKDEVERDLAAVRTRDNIGARNLPIAQNGRKIVRFVIWFLCSQRASVSASVVTDRVETFAEGRPDVIPNGRIYDPIVEENDRPWSAAAFLVVEA
jgi:hypothetical protein